MFYGLWLLVLGALAVPSLVLRKPELAALLAKITPYQGWIGAVSAVWGAFALIRAILHIGMLSSVPLWWLTWVATSVVTLALGLLLGVGVMKTFVSHPDAQAKLDQTVAKLTPYQGTLGLVALGIGAWCIIAWMILL
jgi:hypothetical protein